MKRKNAKITYFIIGLLILSGVVPTLSGDEADKTIITLIDEGFEDNFPPTGWSNTGWLDTHYGDPHTGDHHAYSWSAGDTLTTPTLSFGEDTELTFWYASEIGNPKTLDVYVDSTVVWSDTFSNTAYQQASVNLDSYTGDHVIKFMGMTSDFDGQMLDDIIVTSDVDIDPPVITNVDAQPPVQIVGGTVEITCTVTDNKGVDDVYVNMTYPDSSNHDFPMSGSGSYSFSQTYSQYGTYRYHIYAIDINGNTAESIQQTFIINSLPTADFTFAPGSPTTADIVSFTDQSSDIDGTIVSWFWDFDDGSSSTVQNPTHQFDDGSYTVELTVTDDYGGVDSFFDVVVVSNLLPTADFSFTPTTPSTADTVDFTDLSDDPDGTIVSWSWDFGDGGSSTAQHPGYSFTDDGTFMVELTVTDDDGGTDVHTDTITVTNVGPIADFSYSPVNPTTQDIVSFTDESTDSDGTLVSWFWDFGDGDTSTLENPTHQYDNGVYTIELTVWDDDGASDTTTDIITVTNAPPIADFSYTPVSPTTQDIVSFTDLSSDFDGMIMSWSWDFGDGGSSTVQNPTHQFDDGVYTVTLTVTDDDGATDDYSEIVTVLNILPVADFSFTPTSPTTADVVSFTDASTDVDGTVVSWSWDFGDGGSSSDQNPMHQFDDGTYIVELTVTDDDGGTDVYTDSITVTNIGPTADFTFTPASPSTADVVSFTDLSADPDGSIVSWSWDFGDGGSSSTQHPGYSYSDDGVYTVTLTVMDDDGATDVHTDSITVTNVGPTASFTYDPLVPSILDTVIFTDTSVDSDGTIVSWYWDFDDGTTSTEQHPSHLFSVSDQYSVSLTVTDDDGATDIIIQTIEVTPPVETVDVNQSIQDRGFPVRHALDGDWGAAQSFIPTKNKITKVGIYMRVFGTPEFDLVVELREDDPEGTLLDTVTFAPGDVSTSWDWLEVDFVNTTVTPGTQYMIVCPPAPSGVTTSFGYEWGYAFGNQYDDGAFWFTRDGGGLWRDLPTMYEFTFRTYGV